MTPRDLLRGLGAADVVAGLALALAAGWFGDQLGLGTTTVRIAGVVLAIAGVDTIVLAGRPVMAKVGVALEALGAVAAVDVLLLADPTTTGAAILAVTAVACTAGAVLLAVRQRTPSLAAA